MMKRYSILWAVAASVLALSSCLNEHPKDQLEEDKIYSTASDIYVNAVASLYNYIGGSNESVGIQGTCRGIYDYNTLTTDEAIIPIRGGDWYDGGLWNAMYKHKWTAAAKTSSALVSSRVPTISVSRWMVKVLVIPPSSRYLRSVGI